MTQPTDNPTNLDEMLESEELIEEELETGEEGKEESEELQDAPDNDANDDADDDSDIPEKFRGKSVKEVVQSYTELEKSIHQKVQTEALKIAQQLMQGQPVAPAVAEAEEDDDINLTDEEISKMSPKEFIKLVNKNAIERAQRMVAKTIQQQNAMTESVRREIKEVTKVYPTIKENKNFRSIVIDMIDAASARGQKLTLRQAADRAAEVLGIKTGTAPKAPAGQKPKLRTATERPRGTDGGQNKTDDEIVKEGILNAGRQSTPLGGLGI